MNQTLKIFYNTTEPTYIFKLENPFIIKKLYSLKGLSFKIIDH